MNVKSEFIMIKNIPNILEYSKSTISRISVPKASKTVVNIISTLEDQMNHFTMPAVMAVIKNPQSFEIIKDQIYPLHVSYNNPTSQIIINIYPFNVDNITAINPDPRNIYACLAYGSIFKFLIKSSSSNIKDVYSVPIIGFLTSMMVQIFGREYGLLGRYSTNINILKFLMSAYVLTSFFKKPRKEAYEKSKSLSMFDYRDVEEKLNTYNFSNIDDLIKSLSELKVLPGITKYHFAARIFKMLSESFLPALEDLSRFISIISVSSIPGTSIIPRFISKYNQDDYESILDIGRIICSKIRK